MKRIPSTIWTCAALSLGLCGRLVASDFGFGPGGLSSARVGSVVADPQGEFAAYYNPALIAAQSQSRIGIATSFGSASFAPLSSVLTDSHLYRTQEQIDTVGDYAVPGKSHAHWAVGYQYPFSLGPVWEGHRAGLGVTLSGPFSKVREFVSLTPYDFTPLRYGSAPSQFKAAVSGAVELLPSRLFVGVGMNFYVAVAGNGDANVLQENPTGRLAVDVSLNSRLTAGVYLVPSETFTCGFVYHQQINPRITQELSARAQILENTETFEIPYQMQASLYFEPHVLEWEMQKFSGPFTASAGLSYEFWNSYQPPYAVLTTRSREGAIQKTQYQPPPFRNTLNPRVSLSYRTGRFVFAGGYRFRQTPLIDFSGPTNLLDSNTHIVGLGLSYEIASVASLIPLRASLYGQGHFFESVDVEKSNPDYIGAPGYRIGGHGFFYGLLLEAML